MLNTSQQKIESFFTSNSSPRTEGWFHNWECQLCSTCHLYLSAVCHTHLQWCISNNNNFVLKAKYMDLDNPFHTHLWHKFLMLLMAKSNFSLTILCCKMRIVLFLFEGYGETTSILAICCEGLSYRYSRCNMSHLLTNCPRKRLPFLKLPSGADSFWGLWLITKASASFC